RRAHGQRATLHRRTIVLHHSFPDPRESGPIENDMVSPQIPEVVRRRELEEDRAVRELRGQVDGSSKVPINPIWKIESFVGDDALERRGSHFCDNLANLASRYFKALMNGLARGENGENGATKRLDLQRPFDIEAFGDVVQGTLGGELLTQPYAMLG